MDDVASVDQLDGMALAQIEHQRRAMRLIAIDEYSILRLELLLNARGQHMRAEEGIEANAAQRERP